MSQQYQRSINDTSEERKKMRQSPFVCGGKTVHQTSANRVVYAKEDFFAAGHVSHQLKNIKNRRKPSQWWCACVEVKSEKTLKPQMRTKCGPSGVTSLSLAIVSLSPLQDPLITTELLWIIFQARILCTE